MVLEELNRDVDLFINSFLQEESLEKNKAVELVRELVIIGVCGVTFGV